MSTPAETVWRVYLPEWLTIYSSAGRGDAGRAECEAHLKEHYAGPLEDVPRQCVPASPDSSGDWEWWGQLLLFNQRGEYRARSEADALAGELGSAAVIVARFSPEERRLRAHGTHRPHDA